MWTISYKGFYIHGYCDRKDVYIQGTTYADFSVFNMRFKSLHGAKCCISRWINKGI